ncbi:hypothetical protein EMIT0P253_70218 [Pseudomonas sp. IT-P253]
MAEGCLSPPPAMGPGAGDQLGIEIFGWNDGVKASPRYDYRPLMLEASIDTNRSGDPR